MIFSNGAMAVGGVVSQKVIRSDVVMPPGALYCQDESTRKNDV